MPALNIIASDYCTYKGILGTLANIQTAIGRQCAGLNTQFASDAKFIQSPTSQAHTINNLWLTVCDLRARLVTLEGCACKITCKDVLVGFSVTFNDVLPFNYKINSIDGKLIKQGVSTKDINVSDLNNGLFFLEIKRDGRVFTEKIVIEK